MLGLMRDIRSKMSAYNAMPCRPVFLVKFALDKGGHVFFQLEFGECVGGGVDRIRRHFLRHVHVFNHRLEVGGWLGGGRCVGHAGDLSECDCCGAQEGADGSQWQ